MKHHDVLQIGDKSGRSLNSDDLFKTTAAMLQVVFMWVISHAPPWNAGAT
jgi:hypothetical protein